MEGSYSTVELSTAIKGGRMKACSICHKSLSVVLMNNRWVCFKCDELLFDIEIECEEGELNSVPTTIQKKEQEPARLKLPSSN